MEAVFFDFLGFCNRVAEMEEEDGEGREEDSPFLGTGAKESVVCRRFLIVKVWVATCETEAGGDQAIHEETYPNEAMDIWF